MKFATLWTQEQSDEIIQQTLFNCKGSVELFHGFSIYLPLFLSFSAASLSAVDAMGVFCQLNIVSNVSYLRICKAPLTELVTQRCFQRNSWCIQTMAKFAKDTSGTYILKPLSMQVSQSMYYEMTDQYDNH